MNEHPASISALSVIPAPPTTISGLPTSISELIDTWQSIGAFAADVGCGDEAARQMRRRGRIAPQHWPHVVAASRREVALLASATNGLPGIVRPVPCKGRRHERASLRS